jgi:hypothetical protein
MHMICNAKCMRNTGVLQHPCGTSADVPRKLPSSSLATAAAEALLKFLEITASTLTFVNPLSGLIHRGAGSPTFCFYWLLGLIISNSLMNHSTKLFVENGL